MIIIIGPSGVGKDSILNKILMWDKTLEQVVSHTTREPRDIQSKPLGLNKEQDGVHYHFVSKEEFLRLDQNGTFLETNEYSDNFYGTSKQEISRIERMGKTPIMIVDVNGADALVQWCKDQGKDVVPIFIKPPSLDVLAKRIRKRGVKCEEDFSRRIEIAEDELAHSFKYDYQVVNNRLEVAANTTLKIIQDNTGY